MPETVWTLNDISPITMGMAFVPVLPWDQLNLYWWGGPIDMLLSPQTSTGLKTNKMMVSGFFGPKP
jgi:hypothetical protein